MSRFDSPLEVVGLFVLATIVSVGLIFLINAETINRREKVTRHEDNVGGSSSKNETTFLGVIHRKMLNLMGEIRSGRSIIENNESGLRRIRHHNKHNNNNNAEQKVEKPEVCYGTDDVLIVVGITCCLNFAFVLAVWGLVRCQNNNKFDNNKKILRDGWDSCSEDETETEDESTCDLNKRKCQSMEELRYVT